MKLFLAVGIVEQVLAITVPSYSHPVNSTVLIASSPKCTKGEQRYDFITRKCINCPRKCRQTPDYESYNIATDPMFGALECFPCNCKAGKKYYDKKRQRCRRCPSCNANSILTNDNITVDKWFGAMNCYQCRCKDRFYANPLTYGQCVNCRNCLQENKKVQVLCSHDTDAVCGDCIDGYKPTEFGRCKKIQVERHILTTTESHGKKGDPAGSTLSPTSKQQETLNHGSTIHRSFIFIVVLLIMVFFILGVAVFFACRIIRNKCCGDVDGTLLSSQSTVSSLMKPNENRSDTTGENHSVRNPLMPERLKQQSIEFNTTEQTHGPNMLREEIDRDNGMHKFTSDSIHITADHVIFQVGDNNQVCQNLLPVETS